MATERLQKILARGGIASRRAAEKLITEGHVRVNGRVVTELGTKADPRNDKIEINGKRVVHEAPVYLILHKPRGVVSTMSDPEGRPTVRELLVNAPGRVYPVGRLDFATSGALFATNDGDFAEGLMHPKRDVPKTYILKVSGVMQPEDIEEWRKGIRLEDGMTLPAKAALIRHEGDKTWLELTIREGRNQQIRRMGDATGFPVMRLSRVAFADVSTEGVRPGEWRHLTRDELMALKKAYGVPRSVRPSTDGPDSNSRSERQNAAPRGMRIDSRGTAHATTPRGRGGRDGEERSGARTTSRNDSRGAAKPRGPNTHARGGGRSGARENANRKDTGSERTTGARYGGGAPGRRSHDVKSDWGGGVERGGRANANDRPRDDLGGGRASRSRTTGTGGGIRSNGGDEASYRISSTRKGRS